MQNIILYKKKRPYLLLRPMQNKKIKTQKSPHLGGFSLMLIMVGVVVAQHSEHQPHVIN